MLTKEIKSKILERFDKKEEKILVSNILDKAFRFEKLDKIEVTNFLNLNEFNIISDVLKFLKIKYHTYVPNQYADKRVILFIPEYIKVDEKLFSQYISCIKVIANVKGKLKHKDYMGSIYNLGVKKEYIGDIFAKDNICYFFVMLNVKNYFFQNLSRVGTQEITLQEIDLNSYELKNIPVNIIDKEYIVSSLRVDTICSSVFSLSRNEVKEKIQKGDLCINDKVMYYSSTNIVLGDIVSLRKCGKIIVKEKVRETRNGNTILKIGKFS